MLIYTRVQTVAQALRWLRLWRNVTLHQASQTRTVHSDCANSRKYFLSISRNLEPRVWCVVRFFSLEISLPPINKIASHQNIDLISFRTHVQVSSIMSTWWGSSSGWCLDLQQTNSLRPFIIIAFSAWPVVFHSLYHHVMWRSGGLSLAAAPHFSSFRCTTQFQARSYHE